MQAKWGLGVCYNHACFGFYNPPSQGRQEQGLLARILIAAGQLRVSSLQRPDTSRRFDVIFYSFFLSYFGATDHLFVLQRTA